jgi:hypothetical protein
MFIAVHDWTYPLTQTIRQHRRRSKAPLFIGGEESSAGMKPAASMKGHLSITIFYSISALIQAPANGAAHNLK